MPGKATNSESLGGRTSDHGRVVVSQSDKHPPHLLLHLGVGVRVRRGEQGAGRRAASEPIARGQSSQQGQEVLLARLRIEEGGNFRDRLGSLVSHEGLFDSGQVFERSEDDPSPFLSAYVF